MVCITSNSDKHDHQFCNTSLGVKQRGDTRTLHIINANTIRDLSKKIGLRLNPSRFRPNIVIEGPIAWSEFDWIVGKTLQTVSGVKLTVINKTVRCKGVSVDPLDPANILDIPELLIKHFPEHGPFLGVYAVVDAPGTLSLGDELQLFD